MDPDEDPRSRNGPLPEGWKLREDRYLILGQKGSGGFAYTYRARDLVLKRKVCIKEYFPKQHVERGRRNRLTRGSSWPGQTIAQWRKSFLEEAQLIASLDHSNIIEIHDFFDENQTSYYVMEYLDGVDLEQWTRTGMAEKRLEDYISQVVDTLGYIHKRGIYHLDIKPANIMVIAQRAVLIDFGGAKARAALVGRGKDPRLAFTGDYAAPELESAQHDLIGPASDIYSLGITIHQLLTRSLPLRGSANTDLPSRWRDLIDAALCQDPSDRPSDIVEWWSLLN